MVSVQGAQVKLGLVNGVFTDSLGIDDRGLAYGDGLFESMLYVDGEIPLLRWHLDRLMLGCKKLRMAVGEQALLTDLWRFLAQLKSSGCRRGKIKLVVTRGSGGRACYPPADEVQASSVILQAAELKNENGLAAVRLVRALQPLVFPPLLVGLKHLSRLPYVLAALDSTLEPEQELMFVDEDGCIVETMHHNIFFLVNNSLVSPQLNKAGVEGVARAIIIGDLAKRLGVSVTLENIHHTEMGRFDACFIANAVRGLSAVEAIDGHGFSSSELFSVLASAFGDMLEVKS